MSRRCIWESEMENITSKSIKSAIDILERDGNVIREVSLGWSKSKVVVIMEKRLRNNQKITILEKFIDLKYYFWKGSTWEPGSDGFYAEEEKEGILFPVDDVNPW